MIEHDGDRRRVHNIGLNFPAGARSTAATTARVTDPAPGTAAPTTETAAHRTACADVATRRTGSRLGRAAPGGR